MGCVVSEVEGGSWSCSCVVVGAPSKCVFLVLARRSRVSRTSSGVGGRRTGCVDAMRRCVYSGIYNTASKATLTTL